MTTPYITEPPWARWGQLVALAARYVCLIALGVMAACIADDGDLLAVAGWVVAGTSLLAVVGVIGHYYRAEWVALSPMIAGLLWVAVLIGGDADSVVTLLVVALAVAQGDRLVHLSRIAYKLRHRQGAAR